jgi:hypothetical protein
MKARAKYTASEILAEAGVESPKFGKQLINIAGINISSANQIVKIQDGVEKIVILAGGEKKEIDLEKGGDNTEISEGAKVELKKYGQEVSKVEEK